jgi:hypothetical protein
MKKLWCSLLLFASVGVAQAQATWFSQLRVEPVPAVAGQPVNFVVHWEGCGYNGEPIPVQVAGAIVTVTANYGYLCGIPLPYRDVSVPLGTFAAGTYTLRFVGVDRMSSPDTPIDIPFEVVGGAPQQAISAPTGSGIAFFTLGGLLMVLAGWRLRSRV